MGLQSPTITVQAIAKHIYMFRDLISMAESLKDAHDLAMRSSDVLITFVIFSNL